MRAENLRRISQDLLELGIPVLVLAAATALVAFALLRWLKIRLPRHLTLFPLAFGILGGTSGAIAGSSFEPLVGALVTGVLGIVSAMISYAFATSQDQMMRAAIPPIIILMLINSLAGLSIGRTWKIKWDNYATSLDRYKAKRDGIWVPVSREYQTLVVRRCVQQARTADEARRACAYDVLFEQ